jgi:hypothetical protein
VATKGLPRRPPPAARRATVGCAAVGGHLVREGFWRWGRML